MFGGTGCVCCVVTRLVSQGLEVLSVLAALLQCSVSSSPTAVRRREVVYVSDREAGPKEVALEGLAEN